MIRKINILSIYFHLCIALVLLNTKAIAQFVHPGILHTAKSLDKIKKNVALHKEPWNAGYLIFCKDARASANYTMNGPYETVSRMGERNGEKGLFKKEFENDCLAAYYNALQWWLTGDKNHALKAISILNGYATTLKNIVNHDRELMSGLCGFHLANAAELLRYSNSGWERADILQFENCLRYVFYPVISQFATFANGNWDAACIKGMMAFGVFLNDTAMFNKAVQYYYHGKGNGSIKHYVINENGQCQESGRDQSHTQFGLGCLAEACEVAYNQKLDLYGANDNLLLKGFEYTAKYNLGEDVPFQEWIDVTGKYRHKQIASQDRGHWRGVYEIVLNHYKKRKQLSCPYTQKAAEKLRPEGAPWTADHPGYGTLLYSIE